MQHYYCLWCGQPMTHMPSDSTVYRSDLYHCPHCKVRWKRIHAISAGDGDSWMVVSQPITYTGDSNWR